MNLEGAGDLDEATPYELADEWIMAELAVTAKKVKSSYETYDMDTAAREIYDFFWTKYCDWYIELSKIRIMSQDAGVKRQVLSVLIYVVAVNKAKNMRKSFWYRKRIYLPDFTEWMEEQTKDYKIGRAHV